MKKGFKENPDDWRFPAYLGFFAYRYGSGETRTCAAARWYEQAAKIPGVRTTCRASPPRCSPRAASRRRPCSCSGQAYLAGDKYARQKAIDGLANILPKDKEARMRALAPLYDTMPKAQADALVAELFKGYSQ